ncbi:hypothetical protein P3T37_006636 [Kitasatospora sp. MAA4]|nr:hypothetical protein [Kitasatospora sp. MAA4]
MSHMRSPRQLHADRMAVAWQPHGSKKPEAAGAASGNGGSNSYGAQLWL